MKSIIRITLVIILLILNYQLSIAQISINETGNNPDASAMLDVSSSDKGILIPRMTTAERTAISNPATSLLVYDTDKGTYWYYENSQWNELATQPSLSGVTTIQEPAYANTFDIGDNPVDMAEQNGYLYILERDADQIRVVNINNPFSPTTEMTFTLPTNANLTDITISGNYAFVTSSNNNEPQLWVFDINSPSSIDTVGSINIGGRFSSIDISGNYAYVTDQPNEKLRVYDISTPSSLTEVVAVDNIYNFSANTPIHKVLVADNYAYVLHNLSSSDARLAVSVVDISTPNSATIVGTDVLNSNFTQEVNTFIKYGDYLYFDFDGISSSIRINVSTPSSPNIASGFGADGAGISLYTIALQDNYVIINGGTGDYIEVKDFSTSSTNPSTVYTISTNNISSGAASDMLIIGSFLYTITSGDELIIHQIAPVYTTAMMANGTISTYEINNSLGTHVANQSIQLNDNWLSNDGDDEGISIANNGQVTFSDNILLNSNWLSNDGGGEGISIANNGQVTFSDNILLNSNWFSNDGDNEGMSIDNDGNINLSNTLTINDDFLVGTDNMSYGGSGNESKLFFDKSQFAFRVGRAYNTNWDVASLGLYSFATGTNTLATGNNSVAFGYQSLASGTHAFAGGNQSEATGHLSLAFGREVFAPSYGEVALGLYSTTYTPNDASDYDANDRLFVIGNGSADNSRSDAMTIYKNGNTVINGNITANNIAFSSENGVTTSSNNSDDFVFGADALDYTSGTELKFFFDRSKGAFRAGSIGSSDWDESNIGDYSVAMGILAKASGFGSVAFNGGTATDNQSVAFTSATASAVRATAFSNSTASGDYSTAFSEGTASSDYATAFSGGTANGEYATAFGLGITAKSYSEFAIGVYNTTYTADNTSGFDADDRLFIIGNGTGSSNSNRSDAMVVYKSGNTEINGQTTISDAVEGTDFILTVENTTNDNTNNNNGIEIIAGHDTYNNSSSSGFIKFSTPSGTTCGRIIQSGNNSIQSINTSDIRLKENILPSKYGLSDILKIEVRDYNFKLDPIDNVKTGFLAQQLYEVFPTAVAVGGEDAKIDPWMVDYSSLTPLLVKGIQDQQAIIDQQENRIEQLESENQIMKAEVSKIKQLEQQNAEMKAMLEQIQAQLGNQ